MEPEGKMDSSRPRFSMFVHFYVGAFLLIIGLLPACFLAAGRPPLWSPRAAVALLWPAMFALLFLYARRRCSSEKLDLHEGLLFVAASMITGWTISRSWLFFHRSPLHFSVGLSLHSTETFVANLEMLPRNGLKSYTSFTAIG